MIKLDQWFPTRGAANHYNVLFDIHTYFAILVYCQISTTVCKGAANQKRLVNTEIDLQRLTSLEIVNILFSWLTRIQNFNWKTYKNENFKQTWKNHFLMLSRRRLVRGRHFGQKFLFSNFIFDKKKCRKIRFWFPIFLNNLLSGGNRIKEILVHNRTVF